MAEVAALEPEEWELWDSWMRAQRLLEREVERGLQREFGISKAEFSVLVTLWQAPDREQGVGELCQALAWEKSRVSHLLTRMENRGLVARTRSGPSGRRTRMGLTALGRGTVQRAILGHGGNVRRYFIDSLTAGQAAAIRAWSEQVVDRLEPRPGDPCPSPDQPET
jgi:DNA-binding MarR family transcriptional regulator